MQSFERINFLLKSHRITCGNLQNHFLVVYGILCRILIYLSTYNINYWFISLSLIYFLFLFYRCLLGCCHFCREPWSVTHYRELLHLNFSITPSFVARPILHLLQTWWKVFDTAFVNLTVLNLVALGILGKNLLCPELSFGFAVQISSRKQ